MIVLKKSVLKIPDLPDLFILYLNEYVEFYFLMLDNRGLSDGVELFREVDAKSIRIPDRNLMNNFIEEQIAQIPLVISYFEKEHGDKLTLRFLVKCVSNIKLSQVIAKARGSFTSDYYEQVLDDKVLPIINSYI